MKKLLALLLVLFLVNPAFAGTITKNNTFTSGTTAVAGEVNANFDTIYSEFNGSISNTNISGSAAIVGSKLDLSAPGAIGGSTPSAGTFTTLQSNGNTTIGDASGDTVHHNANTITYEGATADDFETTFAITDPTADRTITFPDGTLTVIGTGANTFTATQTFDPASGIGIDVQQDTTADAVEIDQTANGVAVDINKTGTGAGVAVDINNVGTGGAIVIVHAPPSGGEEAININMDSNNGSDTYAITIVSDNAGAGVGAGINFSTMSDDEPNFQFQADAITTAGTVSQQIAIDIGGTIYYLIGYTHGS